MTDRRTKIFLLFILLLFMSGCAATIPEPTPYPSPLSREEGKKQQQGMLSDEELFNLGLSYLSSPDLNPDYMNAFLAFKRLTEKYPDSTWNDIAQHFTTLLERYLKLSMDNSRLSLENQDLSKEKKLLEEEKTHWEQEKEGLLAEIASLKYDLECLKQIEIESEKREKNVR